VSTLTPELALATKSPTPVLITWAVPKRVKTSLPQLTSRGGLVVLFLVSFGFGCGLPALTIFLTASRGVQIKVEANIQAGNVIRVYINGYRREPRVIPIAPATRQTYTVPRLLEDVSFLRIDLGHVSGARVELFGITVSINGQVAKRYDPDVIQRWIQDQPETVRGQVELLSDRVSFVQKGEGPSLIVTDEFRPGVPSFVQWLLPLDRDGIVLGFWLAFLLVIALARQPLGVQTVLLITIPAASILAVRVAYATANWPDPVDQAVGVAAFRGLSLVANRLATFATLIAALATSAISIFLSRRLSCSKCVVKADGSIGAANRYETLFVALVILVIFAMHLARVNYWITELSLPFINDWDNNAVNGWRYLTYSGLRPLIDFWFPYGGTWVFALPAPWGQLSQAMLQAAVYILCFLGLVRVCGLVPAILILYIVLVSDRIQLMWAPWRYLVGVNVVLTYAAIGEDRTRFGAGHLLFGIALSLAIFFEPVQVAYAAPAIAVKLLLDLAQGRTRLGWSLLRRAVAEFAVPLAYLVTYFLVISDLAELKAILSYLFSLGPHAYSAAKPTDLATPLARPFGVGFLLLAGPSSLIAVGLYRRLSRVNRIAVLDDVIIGLGLVGFMYFQKQLVRPADWQFVAPTVLAMLIWLVSDPALRRGRISLAGGVAAGILFWSLILTRAPVEVLQEAIAAPRNAMQSMAALVRSSDMIAKARENTYAPVRFSSFPELSEVVARLRTLGGGELPSPVYGIGDLPMLYALLRQAPPFNTNDFDSSPIFEQQRVIDWLVRHEPQFAVWNTNDLRFDEFQRVIRVPLLYAFDAAMFVPIETIGDFAILKRRKESEPPNLAWWRNRLGDTLDFGGLLRRSSFDRLAGCTAAPALDQCTPFLEITVPQELRSRSRLSVPIAAGNLTFHIAFAPSPKVGIYRVRLDRLWFWKSARLAGLPIHLLATENPLVTATISIRAHADDLLY
jgi:hypothetical protein